MATPGHIYRDTWYSGQRCHCCNLTDADLAARQAASKPYAVSFGERASVTVTWWWQR